MRVGVSHSSSRNWTGPRNLRDLRRRPGVEIWKRDVCLGYVACSKLKTKDCVLDGRRAVKSWPSSLFCLQEGQMIEYRLDASKLAPG